ncbi:hypothetical protein [Methylobacterium nodulans]|uniref:Uncharacterized protein n=1 Tax=Methylobacterium nodulans (strain LMG 21967 / CNCM I-2342 / ORS 2060) TaxID=460265 RepID=B8IPB9_METNO|nr:hypothetical protein [Methylobacterium nodulans]ACL60437.1 conserved hypothetical protein [Methylobacterium nodulans ORS 2060]
MLLRPLTPALRMPGASAGDPSDRRSPPADSRSKPSPAPDAAGQAANWAEAFRREYPDLFEAPPAPVRPRPPVPRLARMVAALLFGTAIGAALGPAALRPHSADAGRRDESAHRLTQAEAQVAALSQEVRSTREAEAAARAQAAQAETRAQEAGRRAAAAAADEEALRGLRKQLTRAQAQAADRAQALDTSAAALAASEAEVSGLRRSLAEATTALSAAEAAVAEARSGRAAAEAALAEAQRAQESAQPRPAALPTEPASAGASAVPPSADVATADDLRTTVAPTPRFVSFHAAQPISGTPFTAFWPSDPHTPVAEGAAGPVPNPPPRPDGTSTAPGSGAGATRTAGPARPAAARGRAARAAARTSGASRPTPDRSGQKPGGFFD